MPVVSRADCMATFAKMTNVRIEVEAHMICAGQISNKKLATACTEAVAGAPGGAGITRDMCSCLCKTAA